MMRRARFMGFVLLLFAVAAYADKPRKPAPPLAADKYALHDAHSLEKVTIAAEPGDVPEARPNTRLDYFHHGYMPMRVIVTNDSDEAIRLDDARIVFVTADSNVVLAATDEELQRRLFSLKSATGTKIPLPLPLPSITIHHKPVDKQLLADDEDFGFKTTTVAPHTTVAGYLFYDVREVDDPVLGKATLELRKVRWVASDKALESFEIPLGPTPSADVSSPGDRK